MHPSHTKIVCTIGPAVASLEKILQLIDAGMNVARLNFSHGDAAQHQQWIALLKEARNLRNVPLAILMDTKGPELRVGSLEGGQIAVTAGHKARIKKNLEIGTNEQFSITPSSAINTLEKGMEMLFADGYIIAKVIEKTGQDVVIEFQNNGILKTHNNLAIPSASIQFPLLTDTDRKDIALGCELDIDIVAASFTSSIEQIQEIKRVLTEHGKPHIRVMAKIENGEGVKNFKGIVQVADCIMVARGDLGIELPLEKVPPLQKMMIRESYRAGKPVLTATQMLESMIKNPRPTRAEVSDVANAIYDGTSAVMLSGETTIGQYPVETVKIMRQIIAETESDFPYEEFFEQSEKNRSPEVCWAVSSAAVKTAYHAHAKAIFVVTDSGMTANLISRHRPSMPIFALSPHPYTYHQLALSWGVIPVDPKLTQNIGEAFEWISKFASERGVVKKGDLVIVTLGAPYGIAGSTNTLIVETIR